MGAARSLRGGPLLICSIIDGVLFPTDGKRPRRGGIPCGVAGDLYTGTIRRTVRSSEGPVHACSLRNRPQRGAKKSLQAPDYRLAQAEEGRNHGGDAETEHPHGPGMRRAATSGGNRCWRVVPPFFLSHFPLHPFLLLPSYP